EDVDIKALNIKLPEGIRYLQTTNLRFNYKNASGDSVSDVWRSDRITRISDQHLLIKRSMDENITTKTYILLLDTERTGSHTILLDLEYEIDNEITMTQQEKVSFEVVDPGLEFRVTLEDRSKLFTIPQRLDEDDNEIDIQGNHPYWIRVYAQNRNSFADVTDIDLWIDTDLATFDSKHYTRLEAEKQVIPWGVEIIPPELISKKQFLFNVSANFRNDFGLKVFNTTEFEITVLEFEPIEIDHDSSEGMVLESKEKSIFTVTLDNQRVTDIRNVFVHDEIAEVFEVTGVTSNKLKLLRDEVSEVYKYEIIPPVIFEKQRYNITTYVTYFDDDLDKELNYSETSVITVIPREPSIDFELDLVEPSTVYPGSLIDATYTLTNEEEEEPIRDITITFPIGNNFDIIGPRSFYIDRLEPEESIELKDIISFRPKFPQDTQIPPTTIEFYDQYGNFFQENITGETIEIERGLISGPAIFLTTIVPPIVNISERFKVFIEARNLGSQSATAQITAGSHKWDITVPKSGLKTLEYFAKYDSEGTYALPTPIAKSDFLGRELYTGAAEKKVEVMLVQPNMTLPEAIPETVPKVQAAPTDIDEIEEGFIEEEERVRKLNLNFKLFGIIALAIMVIVVAIIFIRRGKKETKAPFFE
ncbi:hypothetical protein ACFL0V_05645, partial [Nanoarchaeota archaeon]